MTAAELKTVRETAHLSQTELADLLDVHRMTINRWESGRWAIPALVEIAVQTILKNRA